MRTLFLAWQDPIARRWYPVGRLDYSGGLYSFAYTRGAEQARTESGFQALASLPDLHAIYVSEQLFPLFSNRLPPRSRPEYREYLRWLSLPEFDSEPMVILARSGGGRVTDTLEVFPSPEETEQGEYQAHFFVHGLNHIPCPSADRAAQLQPGEPLLAMRDFQNPKDPHAIALRTAEKFDRDVYLIGYCPRYLTADFLQLLRWNLSPKITVERVNLPPAPVQLRVLCTSVMQWPAGFRPFSTGDYEPLVPKDLVTSQISLPGASLTNQR